MFTLCATFRLGVSKEGPTRVAETNYSGNVLEYQYGRGEASKSVTHYLIEGPGHGWSSVNPNSDNPEGTFLDATPIIMDCFSRWTL